MLVYQRVKLFPTVPAIPLRSPTGAYPSRCSAGTSKIQSCQEGAIDLFGGKVEGEHPPEVRCILMYTYIVFVNIIIYLLYIYIL